MSSTNITSPDRNTNSSKRKQKQGFIPRPNRARPNVYQACSSLLDVDGREISWTHSFVKPAGPDEILSTVLRPAPDIPEVEENSLGELPDCDLLKALHHYAGSFYERKSWGDVGYWSMDEGAMLTMGVLLEEMVKHELGKNGDLAFIERDSRWESTSENDNQEGEDEEEDGEEDVTVVESIRTGAEEADIAGTNIIAEWGDGMESGSAHGVDESASSSKRVSGNKRSKEGSANSRRRK